jgi:transposase
MAITTLGIDLAKSTFHLHGVDARGKVVLHKNLSRDKLTAFMANLPQCLVGMEACGSAHHWAREFTKMGHTVRLMNPKFVAPYVKTNKNDFRDAEAICEAVTRPTMRFVAPKTTEQQAVLAVHRSRERVLKARTALCNQARGILLEHGIAIPLGTRALRSTFVVLGEAENLHHLLRDLANEWCQRLERLDEEIATYEAMLRRFHRESEASQRLETIPGVGLLTATALVATIGDARFFKSGRQMAAYLGLVPRQHSTGGRTNLLGISKRGDRYLRKLLVHGGRAVVSHSRNKDAPHYLRVKRLHERKHANVVAVAVANRNVRIAWALLTRKEEYQAA